MHNIVYGRTASTIYSMSGSVAIEFYVENAYTNNHRTMHSLFFFLISVDYKGFKCFTYLI